MLTFEEYFDKMKNQLIFEDGEDDDKEPQESDYRNNTAKYSNQAAALEAYYTAKKEWMKKHATKMVDGDEDDLPAGKSSDDLNKARKEAWEKALKESIKKNGGVGDNITDIAALKDVLRSQNKTPDDIAKIIKTVSSKAAQAANNAIKGEWGVGNANIIADKDGSVNYSNPPAKKKHEEKLDENEITTALQGIQSHIDLCKKYSGRDDLDTNQVKFVEEENKQLKSDWEAENKERIENELRDQHKDDPNYDPTEDAKKEMEKQWEESSLCKLGKARVVQAKIDKKKAEIANKSKDALEAIVNDKSLSEAEKRSQIAAIEKANTETASAYELEMRKQYPDTADYTTMSQEARAIQQQRQNAENELEREKLKTDTAEKTAKLQKEIGKEKLKQQEIEQNKKVDEIKQRIKESLLKQGHTKEEAEAYVESENYKDLKEAEAGLADALQEELKAQQDAQKSADSVAEKEGKLKAQAEAHAAVQAEMSNQFVKATHTKEKLKYKQPPYDKISDEDRKALLDKIEAAEKEPDSDKAFEMIQDANKSAAETEEKRKKEFEKEAENLERAKNAKEKLSSMKDEVQKHKDKEAQAVKDQAARDEKLKNDKKAAFEKFKSGNLVDGFKGLFQCWISKKLNEKTKKEDEEALEKAKEALSASFPEGLSFDDIAADIAEDAKLDADIMKKVREESKLTPEEKQEIIDAAGEVSSKYKSDKDLADAIKNNADELKDYNDATVALNKARSGETGEGEPKPKPGEPKPKPKPGEGQTDETKWTDMSDEDKKALLQNLKDEDLDDVSEDELKALYKEKTGKDPEEGTDLKEWAKSQDTGEWDDVFDDAETDDGDGEDAEIDDGNGGKKKLVNPKKEWHRKKNKATGKATKSYYNGKKDENGRPISITAKEFKDRVKAYQNAKKSGGQTQESFSGIVSFEYFMKKKLFEKRSRYK